MGHKGEKFLFNQNIFDEPEVEEEEIDIPPAPTFSEEELETVRQTTHDKAYAAGKKDGADAEKASRDEQVAQLLQKISHDTGLLFAAEEQRDKVFEEEAVRLALNIFEKLFPLYKQEKGFDELKTIISRILQKQEGQAQISIEVHPDNAEGIKKHIESLSQFGHDPQKYDIAGNDKLGHDAFYMRWKDGGAVRDLDLIANEITSLIKDTLAGTLTNSHDREGKAVENEAAPQQNFEPEPIPDDPEKNQANQNDTIMETPDE